MTEFIITMGILALIWGLIILKDDNDNDDDDFDIPGGSV